jgi:hypothetical protein
MKEEEKCLVCNNPIDPENRIEIKIEVGEGHFSKQRTSYTETTYTSKTRVLGEEVGYVCKHCHAKHNASGTKNDIIKVVALLSSFIMFLITIFLKSTSLVVFSIISILIAIAISLILHDSSTDKFDKLLVKKNISKYKANLGFKFVYRHIYSHNGHSDWRAVGIAIIGNEYNLG